jgi:hypothetical protein
MSEITLTFPLPLFIRLLHLHHSPLDSPPQIDHLPLQLMSLCLRPTLRNPCRHAHFSTSSRFLPSNRLRFIYPPHPLLLLQMRLLHQRNPNPHRWPPRPRPYPASRHPIRRRQHLAPQYFGPRRYQPDPPPPRPHLPASHILHHLRHAAHRGVEEGECGGEVGG